jgi:hypothetical protein
MEIRFVHSQASWQSCGCRSQRRSTTFAATVQQLRAVRLHILVKSAIRRPVLKGTNRESPRKVTVRQELQKEAIHFPHSATQTGEGHDSRPAVHIIRALDRNECQRSVQVALEQKADLRMRWC